jgi:uncharacterized DUF497 family protein
MTFEYDPLKAQTNWQKHGVSFAEAELVFFDLLPFMMSIPIQSMRNASSQWE